jgi:hypothetical protein
MLETIEKYDDKRSKRLHRGVLYNLGTSQLNQKIMVREYQMCYLPISTTSEHREVKKQKYFLRNDWTLYFLMILMIY